MNRVLRIRDSLTDYRQVLDFSKENPDVHRRSLLPGPVGKRRCKRLAVVYGRVKIGGFRD